MPNGLRKDISVNRDHTHPIIRHRPQVPAKNADETVVASGQLSPSTSVSRATAGSCRNRVTDPSRTFSTTSSITDTGTKYRSCRCTGFPKRVADRQVKACRPEQPPRPRLQPKARDPDPRRRPARHRHQGLTARNAQAIITGTGGAFLHSLSHSLPAAHWSIRSKDP
jgi:hypothetical protein